MTECVLAIGVNTDLLEKVEKKLRCFDISIKTNMSAKEAFKHLKEIPSGVLLVECAPPHLKLSMLIEQLKSSNSLLQTISIVDREEKELAEEAFRRNLLFDYFTKPVENIDKLVRILLRAFDFRGLYTGTKTLLLEHEEEAFNNQVEFAELIGAEITDIREKSFISSSVGTLKTLFQHINCPLIILDSRLKIKAINRAAILYFDLKDSKTIVKKPCYETLRFRKEPCEDCMVPFVLETGRPAVYQKNHTPKTNRWEEISLYPICHKHEIAGILVQINDVTPVKEIQKRVAQTEKLASLGLLTSSIAHEINGPNNLILFNIPILRDYLSELLPAMEEYFDSSRELSIMGRAYPELKKDIFTMLDSIQHGSERIKIIVSELSRFIRDRDEKRTRPVSIEEVINRALTICGNKIRRSAKEFEVKLEKDLPILEVNPGDLEQILINFLVNAAQSIDKENSWIKLVARAQRRENMEELHIEVVDNGCGIDSKILDRIFEPFFTTKPVGHGTGLGLTICRTLAEYLGGKIEVESKPGKGSTFRLVLPVKSSKT